MIFFFITILTIIFIAIYIIQYNQFKSNIKSKDESINDLNNKIIELESKKHKLDESLRNHLVKIGELTAEVKLKSDNDNIIKSLSSQILEESSKKIQERSKSDFQLISTTIKEKIDAFNKKIEDINSENLKERATLKTHIAHIVQTTTNVSEQATNLAEALKGSRPKAIGNWGENQLENILQHSSLQHGVDYIREAKGMDISSPDGLRTQDRPDVIVKISSGENTKHIVIDAKTTLGSYSDYYHAPEDEKQAKLETFYKDIRNHITRLANKNYHNYQGINSIELSVMFIPLEGAYNVIEPLFEEALKKNIMIVSPTSLVFLLKTCAYMIQEEKKAENFENIANAATKIYDLLAEFCKSLSDVGESLDKAKDSYNQALNRFNKTQRGQNIAYHAKKLKEYRVKINKDHDLLNSSEDFVNSGNDTN